MEDQAGSVVLSKLLQMVMLGSVVDPKALVLHCLIMWIQVAKERRGDWVVPA